MVKCTAEPGRDIIIFMAIFRFFITALPLLCGLFCFGQADTAIRVKKDTLSFHNPFTGNKLVAANPDLKGNGIKKFLVGKNYRREWIEPVSVHVIDFSTDEGGLIPKKEGGGKETRSLQVEDAAGHGWALRSVKKYPTNALAPELRNTLAEKIVTDDISASYPYGALSMAVLSRAADVPYLKDKLAYIPDDSRLGEYRDKYRNSLVLMEEREPIEFIKSKGVKEKIESISTEELVYKLAGKNTNRVDQRAVLRARLLDNFVMDFDRHEGQWNWLGFDSGNYKRYLPVPKDRDQVFYTNQGLIPKIMRGKERLPELQGFRAKVEHMNSFNRAARNFDRTFLTELSEEDWSREVDQFLKNVTDSVIDAAMKQQPGEIWKYEAPSIAETLKKKRKYFRTDMMRYYRTLAHTVSIVGTNEKEQFLIVKNDDGRVSLTVSELDSLGNPSAQYYHRVFDPSETKELRLYGLEDDDRFIVEGGPSKIKIRMVGGPGQDQFINHGRGGKLIAYDVSFEKNVVEPGIRNRVKDDPQNNVYTRLGYNYKIVGIGPTGEISPIEGILLGASFKIITRGFRKDSFSIRNIVSATHALNSSAMHLRYNGDFIRIAGHTDLQIRGDMMVPTNRTRFFGYGNNTVVDKTKDKEYYRASYNIGNLSILLKHNLSSWLSLSYGPSFQYLQLKNKENNSRFIKTYLDPLGTGDISKPKYYAGGEVRLVADARNNTFIPTRGIVLNGYVRMLKGLNNLSNDVTQAGGSISLYTDFISKGNIVLASIFGVGTNWGNFEFEQAQYLGFTNHLRGYRALRFAGRGAAYNNTELRIKIADINAYLFPATIGIYGFNDLGKVWLDGDRSDTWHNGYGGGIWLAPLKRFVVTGYLSFSKEVKAMPWATIGFVF